MPKTLLIRAIWLCIISAAVAAIATVAIVILAAIEVAEMFR
jgi:hypothetical protein